MARYELDVHGCQLHSKNGAAEKWRLIDERRTKQRREGNREKQRPKTWQPPSEGKPHYTVADLLPRVRFATLGCGVQLLRSKGRRRADFLGGLAQDVDPEDYGAG